MTTGEAAASPKVGIAFSNRFRHVESLSLHPSGAGQISHLNAVILGSSFVGHSVVFVISEHVQKLIEDPTGSGQRSFPNSTGRRSEIWRYSSLIFAAQTKNYSGAKLEGVVRSAVSYALNRQISFDDLTKPLDEESIKVTMDDFLNALHEVGPAFGASMDDLERRSPASYGAYQRQSERSLLLMEHIKDNQREPCFLWIYGIIDCGERHKHMHEGALLLVEQIKDNQSPLVTYLLEGPTGSGKTSMTATIGIESDFPYVKMVSCDIIDERKILTSACSSDEDGLLGFDVHSDDHGQRQLTVLARDE
ncbi:hypothetical protein ZIOFF_040121 [Zingiber officinale]|uniref:Vesicle-fusing ATPase n=1 Tax=Zingiber officinale TaxID=94328 RepID=A0A8J5GEP9_ZINOF|nr:hypothetical protein ZIOFF_040121 [Zingiber officinale]